MVIDGIEIVWIEIRLNKKPILLGNIYRAPNADSEVLSSIEVMMERVASECKEVVLMGDLNLNLLIQSRQADNLLLITSDNNLKQLISEPTRITDHSQTLLDVLFTSNPDLFSATGATEWVGSDHLMIYGECEQKLQVKAEVCLVRSFKKCNKDELLSDLGEAPWQVMHTYDDIDDKWRDLFLSVVDRDAPLVKVRIRGDRMPIGLTLSCELLCELGTITERNIGTLQKQVGCFNHRVVTLIADKLETERFTLVWKTNWIKATQEVTAQFLLYNHSTVTTLRTSGPV